MGGVLDIVPDIVPDILELMLSEKLREFGVVGAGGAGFPTYVKAQSQVEYMIANGAECEPLIHKDAELMKHFPAQILGGMSSMMDSTGAQKGKFGIKTKNAESLEALKHSLQDGRIEFTMLGDFYPSGDEYELVYTATGRLIPAAGIPLQVGCVVNNVETLYNVSLAERDVGGDREVPLGDGRGESSRNRSGRRWARVSAT